MTSSHKDKVPPGISAYISGLDVPPYIKTKAEEIYMMLDTKSVPRGEHKQKLICYCIHQAYVELGDVCGPRPDPCVIANITNLSKSAGLAAISNRPKYKLGMSSKSPTRDCITIMESYVRLELGLPESVVQTMVLTFKRMIEANKLLLTGRVKVTIAAFIVCYLNNNGFLIDKEGVFKMCYVKEEDVSQKYKEINRTMASVW